VLDTFENLRERADQYGSVLSGGEQQMLAIARALVADPDLLLLDEPTEGLAPYVVRDIEDIVRDLNDRGITVLLVEQNIPVALAVSEYTYILEKGHVVHEGPADEVRENDAVLAGVRVIRTVSTGTPGTVVSGSREHDGAAAGRQPDGRRKWAREGE